MGLATDGGLLLPEKLEEVDGTTLSSWQGLSYQELALEVMGRFAGDIPRAAFETLVRNSYASFSHAEITPLVKKGDCYILELFHGPTLAFKDVALQFLGNVFEHILKATGDKLNILGATSGDTGSAAIYGVRGKDRINIFILHPHKRVSPMQELQMTTVTDANVYNIAIRGTFDDGQAIVKTIFNDIPFKNKHHLGAVNSINWARILAQVVYYLYAAFRAGGADGKGQVDFSVPTGNFGDIFAGYVARKIAPRLIRRLILATNENNLLTRFILEGDYSVGTVVPTISPSMDIQVASNFERYLYYLYGEDAGRTRSAMEGFAATGSLTFDRALQDRVRRDFSSRSVTQEETIDTIRRFSQDYGYVLDPHTAVGVHAGLACRDRNVPLVCLATAHPAKFGDAVRRAIGRDPEIPGPLATLAGKETRCEVLDAEVETVKKFIDQHAL